MKIEGFIGKYAFLSNFYPCKISYGALDYPSLEHAYQAMKTFNYNIRLQIRDCPTPGKAKRMGRKLPLRQEWGVERLRIMRNLLLIKFRDEPLLSLLLSTGDAELIEVNGWGDHYWGVCNGVGENHLGILLMEVRAKLRQEAT